MAKGFISRNIKVIDKGGNYRFLRLHLVTYDEASVKGGLPGFLPIILNDFNLFPFFAELPGIIYVDSPLLIEEPAEGTWRISLGDDADF